MTAGKAGFAPMPPRAFADPRFARLHYCVLGMVCLHDRLSLVTGKGQGCWASSATMAEKIGANLTNVSTALNELSKWGYLEISNTRTDKRLRVYRVIYDEQADPRLLPQGQTISPDSDESRLPNRGDPQKVVCPTHASNPQKSSQSHSQYISLSEGIHSAEAEKDIHLKVRDASATRVAAEGQVAFRNDASIHETLAKFEREWKRDRAAFTPNIHQWRDWLSQQSEDYLDEDEIASGRAQRLSEEVDAWIDDIAWENGERDL